MSKHSRKIKSSRKGLKNKVLRKLTIKKKKALSRDKTKKGGGWFRNDRPYFFNLLSKARRSETNFLNRYKRQSKTTKEYLNALNKHIENLEEIDRLILGNDTKGKGSFRRLFIDGILKDEVNRKGYEIDNDNPLLIRNYAYSSYNNLRDLKNGHMRRQIRYKLWKDFEQKSDYIREILVTPIDDNKVKVTIVPVDRKPSEHDVKLDQEYILPPGDVRSMLRGILERTHIDILPHSSDKEGEQLLITLGRKIKESSLSKGKSTDSDLKKDIKDIKGKQPYKPQSSKGKDLVLDVDKFFKETQGRSKSTSGAVSLKVDNKTEQTNKQSNNATPKNKQCEEITDENECRAKKNCFYEYKNKKCIFKNKNKKKKGKKNKPKKQQP